MDLLSLRTVGVGYQRKSLLPPIDLSIRRGTFLGIVGPNGSGKTTLVKTMLGLLPPVAGKLEYPEGKPPRFGYVPQRAESERSFPLSVLDLVLMGRYPRRGLGRRMGSADRRKAIDLLGRLGLAGMEHRSLHALSGGQRQRALIARALATEPEILVLDEPTNGMDIVAEHALLDSVHAIRSELDLGVIIISHHLALIANAVKEVLLLDRQSRRIEHGPVAEVVTSERLSKLYGTEVVVTCLDGVRAVSLDHARPSDELRRETANP
jgi:ABC-type Mn2+/Zn2+ transport system ATPase subunit